jgi:hypothetical protein
VVLSLNLTLCVIGFVLEMSTRLSGVVNSLTPTFSPTSVE